jgi:hypothetical protein
MADSMSWVIGGHSLKLGGDVLKDRNGIGFGANTTHGFQSNRGSRRPEPDWVTRAFDARVQIDVNQYAGVRPGRVACHARADGRPRSFGTTCRTLAR